MLMSSPLGRSSQSGRVMIGGGFGAPFAGSAANANENSIAEITLSPPTLHSHNASE